MERREYETSFRLEESYWWYVGQQILLKQLLEKYYKNRADISSLDVGCGTGITLSLLKKYGTVKGVDVADEAVEFCRKRGFEISKSDVMDLCLEDEKFDVVTSLGVFYHKNVTDDVKGFREIFRVLKKEGRFIIFDCAMMSLYGKHDVAFHGIRRYSKKELCEKLKRAGFKVEEVSYYTTFFSPIVYVKRKLERWSSASASSEVKEEISPMFNAMLLWIYRWELWVLRWLRYPFGVNIMVVARKK